MCNEPILCAIRDFRWMNQSDVPRIPRYSTRDTAVYGYIASCAYSPNWDYKQHAVRHIEIELPNIIGGAHI